MQQILYMFFNESIETIIARLKKELLRLESYGRMEGKLVEGFQHCAHRVHFLVSLCNPPQAMRSAVSLNATNLQLFRYK